MSISQQFRGAVRRFRDAFELTHLYPGARIAEQQRAEQKDYEIRLRDLREREAAGESYAQAMARLTGADPVTFEPEPGDWTPPADPRLDSFGPDYDQDHALAVTREAEQITEQAVGGGVEAGAWTQRVVLNVDPKLDPGSDQYQPDLAAEAAMEDPSNYPGYEPDPLDGLDAELEEPFWAGPTEEFPTAQAWADVYAVPDAFPDALGPDTIDIGGREPAGWAALSEEQRLEYLADRAAEMTGLGETDIKGAADVLARMDREGVPSSEIGRAAETAGMWRSNEATAEAEEAELRHTAEELSRERGELIWPDQVARAQDRARSEVASQAAAEREAAEWRDRNAEADPYANRDLRGELAEEAAEAEDQAAAGLVEIDSSGCNGYAVPGGEAAADEAGSGFMGAPVPEDASAEAGRDAEADETPDPFAAFTGRGGDFWRALGADNPALGREAENADPGSRDADREAGQ